MKLDLTIIICFGVYFVPPLLQTKDYAREIINAMAKIEGYSGRPVEMQANYR
jgi:hypothetical protein